MGYRLVMDVSLWEWTGELAEPREPAAVIHAVCAAIGRSPACAPVSFPGGVVATLAEGHVAATHSRVRVVHLEPVPNDLALHLEGALGTGVAGHGALHRPVHQPDVAGVVSEGRLAWCTAPELGSALDIELTEVVAEHRSAHQHVVVADTVAFGRALFIDGVLQSTERDEARYHHALVHPAMLASRARRRVLVAGGGEGATVREVLRHVEVEEVVMVDLDPAVIRLCRRHFDLGHGAWDSPRLRLLHDDFFAFLARSEPHAWDCILLDLTLDVHDLLARPGFIGDLKRALAEGGAVAVHCGELDRTDPGHLAGALRQLRAHFPDAVPYSVWVESYAAEWAFAVSGPPTRSSDVDGWRTGDWQAMRRLGGARYKAVLDDVG